MSIGTPVKTIDSQKVKWIKVCWEINSEEHIIYFQKKDDVSYYNHRKVTQQIDLYSLELDRIGFTIYT